MINMNEKNFLPVLIILLLSTSQTVSAQDQNVQSLTPEQQQASWYSEAYHFLNGGYYAYPYGANPAVYPYYNYPYASNYYSPYLSPYPFSGYSSPAQVAAPAQAYSSSSGYTIMTATNPTLGTYLTDGNGRTLYHLQTDQGSYASKCIDATCTGSWPPFYSASIKVPHNLNPSDFSTINVNGYKQYQQTVFKGWPLYYFNGDIKSGDINGQGVKDNYGFWSVVSPNNPSTVPANFPNRTSGTTSVQFPTQQQASRGI